MYSVADWIWRDIFVFSLCWRTSPILLKTACTNGQYPLQSDGWRTVHNKSISQRHFLNVCFIRKNSQGHSSIIITIAREKTKFVITLWGNKNFLVIKEMMTNRVRNKEKNKKQNKTKKGTTNRNNFSTVTQSIVDYVLLIQTFRMGWHPSKRQGMSDFYFEQKKKNWNEINKKTIHWHGLLPACGILIFPTSSVHHYSLSLSSSSSLFT